MNTGTGTGTIDTIIPIKLCITLKTNITDRPIKFTPANIFKTTKGAIGPLFNPFVQLDKNILAKVPKNVLQTQYFYLSLFNSLMDMHELAAQSILPTGTNNTKLTRPQKNDMLFNSIYKGTIDVNILTILEALFPLGGKFYNNGATYSVLNTSWTKGNWAISIGSSSSPPIFATNTVPFSKYNISTFNPYRNYTKEYLQAVMNQFLPEIRYGANYVRPSVATITKASMASMASAPPMTPVNPHTQNIENLKRRFAVINATAKKPKRATTIPPPPPSFEEYEKKYGDLNDDGDNDGDNLPYPLINKVPPIGPEIQVPTGDKILFNRYLHDFDNEPTGIPSIDASGGQTGGAKDQQKVLNDYIRNRIRLENILNDRRRQTKKAKKEYPDLCFHITVELELYRGENLTPEQIENAKCDNKWSAVRKAYAEFTGQRYIIKPYNSSEPVAVNPRPKPKARPKGLPVARAAAIPVTPMAMAVPKPAPMPKRGGNESVSIKDVIRKYG